MGRVTGDVVSREINHKYSVLFGSAFNSSSAAQLKTWAPLQQKFQNSCSDEPQASDGRLANLEAFYYDNWTRGGVVECVPPQSTSCYYLSLALCGF
jgi:hypothetical protein